MLWFKNAIIYQINKEHLLSRETIEKALKQMPFTPCGSQDLSKFGWVSPLQNDPDTLVLEVQGQLLIRAKKESKILPAAVVKQAHQAKIAKMEELQQRKLKSTEKATLKDEVLIDLLPRAFSKYNHYWLWIDTVNKRLIVDSASFKQAEEMLALLRKCLGTLAVTPLHSETPVEQTLTEWVKNNQDHSPLLLGDEAELKDPLEGNGTIRCKEQDLTVPEIVSHIEAGKQVIKLKSFVNEKLSFVINNDLTLKRIKFSNTVLDENTDFDSKENDKKIEVDFILMCGILAESINLVLKIFG